MLNIKKKNLVDSHNKDYCIVYFSGLDSPINYWNIDDKQKEIGLEKDINLQGYSTVEIYFNIMNKCMDLEIDDLLYQIDIELNELKKKYKKLVLVGQSFGGLISILYSIKYSSKIKSIILLDITTYIDLDKILLKYKNIKNIKYKLLYDKIINYELIKNHKLSLKKNINVISYLNISTKQNNVSYLEYLNKLFSFYNQLSINNKIIICPNTSHNIHYIEFLKIKKSILDELG